MKPTCLACAGWMTAFCCIIFTAYGAYSQQIITHAALKQVTDIPPVSDAFPHLPLPDVPVSVSYINNEVRGTVTDSSGALPGVSVSVKSQPNIGTTTDLNGKYLL